MLYNVHFSLKTRHTEIQLKFLKNKSCRKKHVIICIFTAVNFFFSVADFIFVFLNIQFLWPIVVCIVYYYTMLLSSLGFMYFFFHWVGKVQFAFLMSIPMNKHTHDINRVNNKYIFYVVRVYLSFPPSPKWILTRVLGMLLLFFRYNFRVPWILQSFFQKKY